MSGPDHHPRRLLLDVMLGKLAVYLRICGYDAAYAGDRNIEADEAVRRVADREDRHLISRDRALIAAAADATLLSGLEISDQLAELRAAGFTLEPADPPSRCGRCNGRLRPVPSVESRPTYAPSDEAVPCWRCRRCGQYFWHGSHVDNLARTLAALEDEET